MSAEVITVFVLLAAAVVLLDAVCVGWTGDVGSTTNLQVKLRGRPETAASSRRDAG
ncbi:MAG TPA: hypothetical protein VGB98_00510 [Pyrinomonadaceae bacterium]